MSFGDNLPVKSKIEDPLQDESFSFLVEMANISLRKTGVEEKRAKVQESKVLLDYAQKAIARLTYLRR